MHEGTTDGGGNSFLTQLAANSPKEQFFSVNRGNDWFNYSNRTPGGGIMTQPQLYDAILGGKLDPLGTYKSADEAYQGYMGLNPNPGPAAQEPWGKSWSPLFLPPQMNSQPGPVTGTPHPQPQPTTQQPNPVGAQPAQTVPTSALAWANSPWMSNMLLSGDRYGEFGTARGL